MASNCTNLTGSTGAAPMINSFFVIFGAGYGKVSLSLIESRWAPPAPVPSRSAEQVQDKLENKEGVEKVGQWCDAKADRPTADRASKLSFWVLMTSSVKQ